MQGSRVRVPLLGLKLLNIMSERRGLGRILKGISDKESATERKSVVADIDKACSDGLTMSGSFSMKNIKFQLKNLLYLMDEDEDFNRDMFFVEFQKLYSLVMAPDKRAEGVFHPSQLLQGCPRQMAYDISGTEPSDRTKRRIGAALQRTFDVGTWYHIYVQNLLYQLGLLEAAEVPVVNKEKYLNGKADGVFKKEVFGEKVVLEIKTMNSWNYGKAVFKPFKKHEFQASLYARELGIKKVLYLYINKDTSEMKDFLMPINEEELAAADKKMTKVIESVKEGELPPRPSACTDRLCDLAVDCPFATLCFKK